MITVTPVPVPLDEPDAELDAEPPVDEFVPTEVPLVLELEPEAVREVVVEFDKPRLEVDDSDDELLPVLVLVLLLLLLLLPIVLGPMLVLVLLLLHVDEGSVNMLVDDDEEELEETIDVELAVLLMVALLAVGAMLVEVVMPVLVDEVIVELAWAGVGPAAAALADELPLLLVDSVPIPDEVKDVLFVALLLEPVLLVPLVEIIPELVEELVELTPMDELLVDTIGDEDVVHVVFEVLMLERLERPEVEVMGVLIDESDEELVRLPMPLVLGLDEEVDGVDGARVAR
jgi:hypothetical protein